MQKRLGLEKDLKFKAQFLELLFIITVLLIVFSPGPVDAYLLGTAIAFTIFGLLLYTKIINGELPETISETIPVGFGFAGILVLSLRATYTTSMLALPVAVLFLLSAGYIVSIGLLPERRFWPAYLQYSVADLKNMVGHVKGAGTDDIKKLAQGESRNLILSFGASAIVFTAVIAAWTETTGQPVELTHIILVITATFISAGALDRWALD